MKNRIKMTEMTEVETRLVQLSKIHTPGKWIPESYIGKEQSGFRFLNLKVPHVRAAQKEGYSFSDQPFSKLYTIWTGIWKNTKIFEVALSAAHFLNQSSIENLYSQYRNIITWQNRIDNWAHSDEMSNCYARLLEYRPNDLYPTYHAWNQSENPWNIRQSLVGLLYYSRSRTRVPDVSTLLHFIEPHLTHPHYYVQKAVGWTLRETWNLYPDETMEFMKTHAPDIPPGGWTAATEKLSASDKDTLRKLRKLT